MKKKESLAISELVENEKSFEGQSNSSFFEEFRTLSREDLLKSLHTLEVGPDITPSNLPDLSSSFKEWWGDLKLVLEKDNKKNSNLAFQYSYEEKVEDKKDLVQDEVDNNEESFSILESNEWTVSKSSTSWWDDLKSELDNTEQSTIPSLSKSSTSWWDDLKRELDASSECNNSVSASNETQETSEEPKVIQRRRSPSFSGKVLLPMQKLLHLGRTRSNTIDAVKVASTTSTKPETKRTSLRLGSKDDDTNEMDHQGTAEKTEPVSIPKTHFPFRFRHSSVL